MPSHGLLVVALAVATVVIGVVMLASTLVRGGGPLATGVVLGVLFVLGGGLRLWLLRDGR